MLPPAATTDSSSCIAGRVGSAFAAELGTMQVSEQTDSLRVLGTDPVDYLVSPRVLACMIAGPVLNIMCLAMGKLTSLGLAFALSADELVSWTTMTGSSAWYHAGVISMVPL